MIADSLKAQAEEEIYQSLISGFGGVHSLTADQIVSLKMQASTILASRIESVVEMDKKTEAVYESATVSTFIDVLRRRHRKDLRDVLSTSPGMKKETAEQIIAELLSS